MQPVLTDLLKTRAMYAIADPVFDDMPTLLSLLTDVAFFILPKTLSFSLEAKEPVKQTSTTTTASTMSAADRQELRRVFMTFDHDGDGRITKEEMRDSLENLGIFISDGDLSAEIGRFDDNRDGCVDISEFRELYLSVAGVRRGEEAEQEMMEAFNVFDVNGDGYISVEELRGVISSLGLRGGADDDDCRSMIGVVDEDGDGRVSYEEFKEMMRKGGIASSS